ncbi:MAG: lysostaphin resistance A-like protein [Arenimonas sp.]
MPSPTVSTGRLVGLHLLPGVILVTLYALLAPVAQGAGIPTFAVILALEVFFLAPFVAWKLARVARAETGSGNPLAALGFAGPPRWRSYFWLVPLGLVAAIAAFEVLRPFDDALKAALAPWLPEWHYLKDMNRYPPQALIALFAVAIFADGIVGPVAEELYFRGYLLPRMQHLRAWAPVLNGALFALYHFWQPMNYPSILVASLVLSGLGWWRRDYRVPLLVHCSMNTLGHLLGLASLL